MDLDLSVGEISAFINQIIEKMKITDSIWLFTKLKAYMDNPKVRIRIMNSSKSIDISKYNGYGEEETMTDEDRKRFAENQKVIDELEKEIEEYKDNEQEKK